MGGGHKHLCVGVTSSPSCHFLDSWAPPSSSPTPTRGPLPTVPFAPCLLPSSWANTPASYSRSCHPQPVTCSRLTPSGSLLRCTSHFSKTSLTTSLETCWPGLAYLSLLCSLFCRAPVSSATLYLFLLPGSVFLHHTDTQKQRTGLLFFDEPSANLTDKGLHKCFMGWIVRHIFLG